MIQVVDSSFLVSLALVEDENHKKASEILETLKDGKLLINNFVLYETLTILLYKRNSFFAREFHNILSQNEDVFIKFLSKEDELDVFENFLNQQNKFSFVDISVINMAKQAGQKILAFDKKLLKEIEKN